MKFSKSKFLSVFCVLFIAAGLVFSGCSSESDGGGETPVTPSPVTSALTGVSITGSSKIAADGTAELTAVPAATGTVTGITYSWEITAGSDYASLSATSGSKVTLTGKNTDTASGHDVVVKVTATWDGTSKEDSHTVNIAKIGEVIVDSLESLELTAGKTSAFASDTVSLTAKAGYTGNPSITYSWTLTAGASIGSLAKSSDSRAALDYDTKTNTLTVANTTASAQTITVKVTAKYGSTTKEATVNITAAALKAAGVQITGTSSIEAAGSTELTATVSPANASETVTWEITAGSDYASLSATSGKKVTLTGKNTTASEQLVTVKVTAGSVNATHNVTVGAKAVEPGSGGEGSSEDLLITFEKGPVASDSRVSSASNKEYSNTSYSTYNGVAYNNGVKLNSGGSMTVTLEKSYTVVFVLGTDKSGYTKGLTIDGTVFAPVDNTVTATLSEGTHTIKNGGSETSVYLVILKGAGSTTGGGTTPEPSTPEPVVSSVTLSRTSLSLTAGGSETITATVNGTNLTDTSVVWSTDKSGVATVNNGQITAVAAGTAVITATAKADSSKNATCTVTVTAAGGGETPVPAGNVIKASDIPLGFAGVNSGFASIGATSYSKGSYSNPVTTRADLVKAVSAGGIIYISGMIDMSDEGSGSKLPAVGAKNTDVSSVMDSWISSKTSGKYTTYKDWISAYSGAVGKSTDDKKLGNSGNSALASTLWTLNNAWKSVIQLNIKSNTILIGLGSNSGIRGGTISINGVSNVAIRNLYLVDAIDMFPHHEKNDGYNSQFDCITVQGTDVKNIWIDHCTFEDTMVMQHVTNGLDSSDEKWQNYDGSCDIKGDAAGVTVSNCHFFKHDKTMLIGSDDKEGSNTVRKISLINNYFDSCVQRLPMVRNSQIHILNNYYEFDKKYTVGDGKTKMSYGIGVRNGSLVYSEANYFGSNMNYPYDGDSGTKSTSKIYIKGDVAAKSGSGNYTVLSSAPFTPSYSYSAKTADDAKAYVLENAGHGKWTVQQ